MPPSSASDSAQPSPYLWRWYCAAAQGRCGDARDAEERCGGDRSDDPLTDDRKSISADQIVNFLAAGSSGAYLLRRVQRDGAEQDTAAVVVQRWKKVLNDFSLENVNAICTDSVGTYIEAAKLLAQDKDLRYSHITWLPCAVHVCNLMLSDIGKDGRDGVVGHREDTIIRARAVVRFIRSHRAALALFRRFFARHTAKGQTAQSSASRGTSGRGRELIYPVQTRFATHYLMLERLLERCHALEEMMINDEWLRQLWRRSLWLQSRSIAYFEGARRTDHERELVEEVDIYLRQQAGPDRQLYEDFRTTLREFHIREGDCAYGGRDGDRDEDTCRGEKETSAVAQWGVGYVLPWEDEDVVTEEEKPEPRDSGVRPADKVTDEQLDRQVRKGRKDSLTRQPASVDRYFGRRVTILLLHEEDAVYDLEPDPLTQDEIEEEPWSDPDDLDAESGWSSDDDAPLSQMRCETRGSTLARPRPSPRPRDGAATGPAVVGRPVRADAQCQGLSIRQRQHISIDSDSDDDDGGYEGSSESEDDMDFDSGAGDAPRGGVEGPRDIAVEEQHNQRHSARRMVSTRLRRGTPPDPRRAMAVFADRDFDRLVERMTMWREVVMGLSVEGVDLTEDLRQPVCMMDARRTDSPPVEGSRG
ncbi:hypothetical protein CBR_g12389 [Chara braunii]|uniref:DUF659 domain-containing protein n=1 Tax=Chara braunii TaxID=69332 RepID=A0A388KS30_CHABU|nr:hypothetical protein CBR_g12389 [Chara braunii]|eukprot:GBG72822.1 hypothetical protein CBR_g12389 [Chara braunii]